MLATALLSGAAFTENGPADSAVTCWLIRPGSYPEKGY
jgi:hypothetical protein